MQPSLNYNPFFQHRIQLMKDVLSQHLLEGLLKKLLPIIIILIAFISVEFYLLHYHTFPLTSNDEADGIGYMARARGPLFQAHPFFGPGYSWAIRIVQTSGLSPFTSGKVVSSGFAIIFVFVAWLILTSFSPPIEALLATIIVAFSAPTLISSVSIVSDMMAVSLALSAMACLLVPQETGRWHYAVAGMLAGLAYLTRYVYMFLFVVPLLIWLIRKPTRQKLSDYVVLNGIFALGFCLISMPWFIFLYQTKGNPLWNMHYRNVAFKLFFQDGRGWAAFHENTAQFQGWWDVISNDPSVFVTGWFTTFSHLPVALLNLIAPIGVIASVSFFIWLSKLGWKKTVFLLVNILYSFLVSLVWIETRYLLLFIPLVAACIASIILAIPDLITSSDTGRMIGKIYERIPLRFLAITLLIFMLGFHSINQIKAHFAREPIEYKLTAKWLLTHGSPESRVMTAPPHITYYSNTHHLKLHEYGFYDAKLEDLPDILTSLKPTYFVYDQRTGGSNFPQFKQLLDPDQNPFPDLLEAVYEVDSPAKIVVYKLKLQHTQ
jgi:hypothetical protein